jgi:hypothetical protein
MKNRASGRPTASGNQGMSGGGFSTLSTGSLQLADARGSERGDGQARPGTRRRRGFAHRAGLAELGLGERIERRLCGGGAGVSDMKQRAEAGAFEHAARGAA